MKTIVCIILMAFAAAATAHDATDARIAQLEARIAKLEDTVEALLLALAEKARTEESKPRRSRATSRADVEQAIRQDCIRRQTQQHGLGGSVPNFALC